MPDILYRRLSIECMPSLREVFGDYIADFAQFEEGCATIAAMLHEQPVGFISIGPEEFKEPVPHLKDAVIHVIEVKHDMRRQGVAKRLIQEAERWAVEQGYFQIRAWSSRDKKEAVPMWVSLGYAICPSHSFSKRTNEWIAGFHVAKRLD